MRAISDHNVQTINNYVADIDEKLEVLEQEGAAGNPDQYSYYVGAFHAFNDALELIGVGEEPNKTAVNTKAVVFMVVTCTGAAAYINRDKIKAAAKKLKTKFKR